MSTFSRRAVLRDGALSVGASLFGGNVFARLAQALPAPELQRSGAAATNRTLVVLQLAGGNDGLHAVVPYTDPLYAKNRPTLAVPANQVIPLTSQLGLNPDLGALKPLWDAGQMAVVENVGYPNPNLSHFQSMYIWQTLDLTGAQGTATTGWLGKYISGVTDRAQHPFTGMDSGSTLLPTAFMAPDISVPAVSSAASFGLTPDVGAPARTADRQAALLKLYAGYSQANSQSAFATLLNSTSSTAVTAAAQFKQANAAYKPAVAYPKTPLGSDLSLIAAGITQGLNLRVGYTTIGGFDTHANELRTHQTLYPEVAQAVAAFFSDLQAQGAADNVIMMTWSEFGRRVLENGSGGTDHGTAAPLFVFGPGVKGGVYGGVPNLADLDTYGNLKFGIDFRSVYATVIQNWLGTDPAAVLGGSFPTVAFL